MEVILLERIERLGQIGDVVSVKPGYARNFLLPHKKALRATDANRQVFETQRADIEANNIELRKEAEQIAAKIEGLVVILIRQASDSGQLYGSVNSRDVAGAVTDAGFKVERRQVAMDQAVKLLGLHPIKINLHPEVSVVVTANVAKTEDEAALQLEAGGAIGQIDMEAEEDAVEAARLAAEAALALADDVSAEAEAAEGLVEEDVEAKLQSRAEGESDADAASEPPAGDDSDGADSDAADKPADS